MRKIIVALLAIVSVPLTGVAAPYLTPNVTRAEAAMLLLQARMESVPDIRDTKGFPDVAPGSWYERYLVLAERYGILDPDPVTRQMHPDTPVRRWEFLKMMTFTFGLPERMSYQYKDVQAGSPAAQYAGLAQTYKLFPRDGDVSSLRPDAEITHADAGLAVSIMTQALNAKAMAQTNTQGIAKDQIFYGLRTYQKISSQSDSVIVIKTIPLHSAASSKPAPFVTAPVTILPVKAGDDVSQLPKLRAEVLKFVNEERKKAGVPALRVNPTLEASAQIYAADMAGRGYFGHVSPEGQTLRNRMESSGYYRPTPNCPGCLDKYELGENLGQGQLTPAEVVRDWMASPSHKSALLNTNFTETGIGITAGIWVQHFGGRK